MFKKDVYASVGTTLVCGIILLLLLWLKLVIPAHAEIEHGIEIGYGVDLDGEVGGSSGGQSGNFGGETDGDFYKKQISVPSFSEKPINNTTSSSSQQSNPISSGASEDFFSQDDSPVAAPAGDKNRDNISAAAQQQAIAREQMLASQKAKENKAKSLGLNAFGNSGGTGSGGFGLGSGKGSGSGSGTGDGIGDGTGSGTKGNPFGRGTSNGHSWSLEGRNLNGAISKPSYRENVEGKITVRIRVDDNGNVISASIGSPTTIADESLRTSTVESAKRTKFSAGKGTVYGEIIYHFKLN